MNEGPSQQTRTFFDQNMTEPELMTIGCGTACVFSTRCPSKESANEDAAAVLSLDEQSAVLVVADGIGGSAAGEHAARIAIESLRKAVREAGRTESLLRTGIITGIEQANVAVQQLGVGAGTTLAAVEIYDGLVRPYHVGDSMILLVGGRGKIKLQTVPHSPVGYGVEAGLLDEQEAMHHESRHVVSNLIGTPDMRIDVGPAIKMARRDTVLLASDGLFDNLYCDRIAESIRKGKLAAGAGTLVHDSLEHMNSRQQGRPSKPDDLTFIAFRLA